MSKWSEYFHEREGFDTIETDKGIATYKISGIDCYIKDIYITKEHRRSGEAFAIGNMISEIAKEKGCKTISGSVSPALPGSTESLLGLLKFGFKLHSATPEIIWLEKEL